MSAESQQTHCQIQLKGQYGVTIFDEFLQAGQPRSSWNRGLNSTEPFERVLQQLPVKLLEPITRSEHF